MKYLFPFRERELGTREVEEILLYPMLTLILESF